MNLAAVNHRLPFTAAGQLRFAVVTPNLNHGVYLRRTIESVLENLEAGDEYFIVDGASSDGSLDVIKQYAGQLTSWISEKDHGQYEAIAKGFRLAGAECLCWINSGDLLLPGALAAARELLRSSEIDLIYGDDLYIDNDDRVISHSRANIRNLQRAMLFGDWTPLQDACFWRRSLYEEVGGLDRRFNYAGDFDFFLRASHRGRCQYVPKVFSAFRAHSGQNSVQFAARYAAEREITIEAVRFKMGDSAATTVTLRIAYWLIIRWRHWVLRRFQRSRLDWSLPCDPRGTIYSVLGRLMGRRRQHSVKDFRAG